jgi:hypothetical protein
MKRCTAPKILKISPATKPATVTRRREVYRIPISHKTNIVVHKLKECDMVCDLQAANPYSLILYPNLKPQISSKAASCYDSMFEPWPTQDEITLSVRQMYVGEW